MRSKGPRWALLPAPSLESFADSRPFLVASRGNLESRRTQGGGFRGAPGGSLPHILSECPAPGHHVCGTNPRRIVLTQGTWRLRRTVGPPSSGALSVGTVLRYSSAGRNARASTGTFASASSFEGINVLTRRGGLFCAVNVFQRGLPLDLIARAKKLWPPHGGSRRAHTRKRETHPSLPSPHTQHCKPIFSPGRTPSCALRRMGRSVSVAEVYALEPQMATASSMKSKHAHCDVHSLPC